MSSVFWHIFTSYGDVVKKMAIPFDSQFNSLEARWFLKPCKIEMSEPMNTTFKGGSKYEYENHIRHRYY